jgi:hypothetical protein
MLLFGGEEHIDRWCAFHRMERGAVMSTEQCWRLAIEWYHDRLKPEWRRFTLDETEAVFARVGLTGPFWSMRAE